MALGSVARRLVGFLERSRRRPFGAFTAFTLIVFIRFALEFTLLRRPGDPIVAGPLANVYHQYAFYALMFFFGVAVLRVTTGAPVRNLLNLVLLTFPAIWMAPLLDGLLLGRTETYEYARPERYAENLTSLFLGSGSAPGLLAMLFAIIILSAAYAGLRSWIGGAGWRSVGRALLTAGLLYLALGYVGTLAFFLDATLWETGFFTPLSLQSVSLLWMAGLTALLVAVLLYDARLRRLLALLRGALEPRLLGTLVLAAAGVGLAGALGGAAGHNPYRADSGPGLVTANDAPFAGVALAAVAIGWVAVRLMRRGAKTEQSVGLVLAVVALGFATLLGLTTTVLAGFALLLAMVVRPTGPRFVGHAGGAFAVASAGFFASPAVEEFRHGALVVALPVDAVRATPLGLLALAAVGILGGAALSLMERHRGRSD